jgi:FemAB-related protein (PEP-CTERM system-associated)
MVAVDSGQIVGALSLFEINHPLFGHYLSSAAFGNDGGLFYDNDLARDALTDEARSLASHLNVNYLLIRTRDKELANFIVDRSYRSFVLELQDSAESALRRLPVKTRNQVRRGMKENFTISEGHEQVEPFFRVLHQHMRDLGSPCHNLAFYRSIIRHLGDCATFLVVRDREELVGGALLFSVNGSAMNYHTVALRAFNKRCPNYLLYWRMLEISYARGLHTFDMGRSLAESSHQKFKLNWGTREVGLFYNYFLVKSTAPPSLDPRSPKFRLAVGCWKKLPLFVTQTLGPRLISGIA